jgi:hypothetical protein
LEISNIRTVPSAKLAGSLYFLGMNYEFFQHLALGHYSCVPSCTAYSCDKNIAANRLLCCMGAGATDPHSKFDRVLGIRVQEMAD